MKLLHLYYDLMNLYGEYGNIKILESHIKDQGYDVIVDKKSLNDEIRFDEYDFIYIGSGTEKNQDVILEDLKTRLEEDFKDYIEQGKNLLLTGNSYEILGKRIDNREALGILEFETERTEKRNTSDIVATSKFFNNKVVGFVNNMSSIKNNSEQLFNIEFGIGENEDIKKEGILYKNTIGTHLIGPILVRNPEILKYIIIKICTQKFENFEYKEIKYEDEKKGYELVLNELTNRSKNNK